MQHGYRVLGLRLSLIERTTTGAIYKGRDEVIALRVEITDDDVDVQLLVLEGPAAALFDRPRLDEADDTTDTTLAALVMPEAA